MIAGNFKVSSNLDYNGRLLCINVALSVRRSRLEQSCFFLYSVEQNARQANGHARD